MSITQAALAAVSALAKEHPGLTSLEAAAYALGFVEGKECEDTRVPEASEDFYKHLNKEWLEVRLHIPTNYQLLLETGRLCFARECENRRLIPGKLPFDMFLSPPDLLISLSSRRTLAAHTTLLLHLPSLALLHEHGSAVVLRNSFFFFSLPKIDGCLVFEETSLAPHSLLLLSAVYRDISDKLQCWRACVAACSRIQRHTHTK